MAARIFTTLAEQLISVDTIIQSQRCRLVNGVATRDIAFTVAQDDADAAQAALTTIASEIGNPEIQVDRAIAKVSVVGTGMVGRPGVAAQMFDALARENINIQMITTSEIKISCVVDENQGIQALRRIHDVFKLGH
jgi:aspartate kinase